MVQHPLCTTQSSPLIFFHGHGYHWAWLCACQVHLALVRYHEAGRFCQKDEEWDRETAIFHLQQAADLGELEAIVGLGLMCAQLPHHLLADVSLQVSPLGLGWAVGTSDSLLTLPVILKCVLA